MEGEVMEQLSETELTNRINSFLARKMEQYPELQKSRRHAVKKPYDRKEVYNPTFLEKLNDLWIQRVHA